MQSTDNFSSRARADPLRMYEWTLSIWPWTPRCFCCWCLGRVAVLVNLFILLFFHFCVVISMPASEKAEARSEKLLCICWFCIELLETLLHTNLSVWCDVTRKVQHYYQEQIDVERARNKITWQLDEISHILHSSFILFFLPPLCALSLCGVLSENFIQTGNSAKFFCLCNFKALIQMANMWWRNEFRIRSDINFKLNKIWDSMSRVESTCCRKHY